MIIKFPLFLSILKKYIWASLIYFAFCITLLFIFTYFTSTFSSEHLKIFILFLFLFGFIGGLIVFSYILLSFFKPLISSIKKIEELAQSSSEENSPSINPLKEEGLPIEFYNLNKNLNLIYKNIQQKSRNLAMEKAELKAITFAVSDAIIAIDLQEKIIFSNPQSKKLFLLENLEKAPSINQAVRSIEIANACKKCLQFGTSSKLELDLTVGEYKQSRLFDISISPLIHTKNQIDGAVIVFYDKTEIKHTEKIQSDFVANVSHELKTPLTVINGFIETMITDLESESLAQIHNFLNIVNRNVKRLIDLVDDLLSLSSIDSELVLKKQSVNTKEITALVCETIKTDHHKINCIFKVDTVLASRRWLEQILHNLITNAVKYTPKGSIIDIIWEKHPHFILLTVKDDGEGIPIQHQSRIFERFYRVDADRSREKGGTGIGLAIVKQVMEKHGGHVYLTSRRRGKGAQFTCTFPR